MITELTELDLQEKTLNKEKVNTINARLLWQKLESKQQFSHWIENRIEKYEFVENIDFINIDKIIYIDGTNISRTQKEYYITLDMAKELCMIENNENGKQWRKFFINCQKALFSLEKNRYKQIANRINMTDKIKETYTPNDRFYIYTNYTKLIYRKVFGFSDVKQIKKKFNLSEKEEIRKSLKIPYELQKKITDTEEAVACFLTTLQYKKVDKETCYNKVKEFLFGELKIEQ